jgi:hypothetical protein
MFRSLRNWLYYRRPLWRRLARARAHMRRGTV